MQQGEDVSLLREARLTDADDAPVTARDDDSEIDWCMSTPPEGLSTEEASARAKQYGPNMLSEKKRNELLVFLSYFSGPMPIMIWVATLVVALDTEAATASIGCGSDDGCGSALSSDPAPS